MSLHSGIRDNGGEHGTPQLQSGHRAAPGPWYQEVVKAPGPVKGQEKEQEMRTGTASHEDVDVALQPWQEKP